MCMLCLCRTVVSLSLSSLHAFLWTVWLVFLAFVFGTVIYFFGFASHDTRLKFYEVLVWTVSFLPILL